MRVRCRLTFVPNVLVLLVLALLASAVFSQLCADVDFTVSI